MNVPNALSMLRILMVPVFVSVYFSKSPDAPFIALFVLLFAGLTDILDGVIARKYHLITRLGRILDPLADKLMIFSALACVSIKNLLPWWIAAIYLIKEIIQIITGVMFFSRMNDVPSSNFIGKGATITFYIAIAVLILFENVPYSFKLSLFLLGLFFTITAFAVYYHNGLKIASAKGKLTE